MNKLPRITGRQVVSALQKLGFKLQRIQGSHHFLYHAEKDVTVSVPVHVGKTIAPKTLSNILKIAKVSREDFIKALKE
ncbi:MAG: type II toxin-antitoxin system HicA family toxin [Armatimonadetes bacterium]|nr:type II toxin-antitoxin system HicA family toxin [Armatimonadota bacterium]MDW8028147.1 type II toxin-antitoxin system HicA family toxin [Armatimonadota bacterium]